MTEKNGPGEQQMQAEMPFAVVLGNPITELPLDLYIPPDALEVFMEAFEGPLDLLLYLIKKQNLDILDIPVAPITHQYLAYIELMQNLKLELAAEYLVMAAVLAEVKSRMLLPRPESNEDDEADPRADLVRRLQEYDRYRRAAEDLDALARLERDYFLAHAQYSGPREAPTPPEVKLPDLIDAMREVMRRVEVNARHAVKREPLSVRERMSRILDQAHAGEFVEFVALFTVREGRAGVVVTMLAILELSRQALIEVSQPQEGGKIYVRAAA